MQNTRSILLILAFILLTPLAVHATQAVPDRAQPDITAPGGARTPNEPPPPIQPDPIPPSGPPGQPSAPAPKFEYRWLPDNGDFKPSRVLPVERGYRYVLVDAQVTNKGAAAFYASTNYFQLEVDGYLYKPVSGLPVPKAFRSRSLQTGDSAIGHLLFKVNGKTDNATLIFAPMISAGRTTRDVGVVLSIEPTGQKQKNRDCSVVVTSLGRYVVIGRPFFVTGDRATLVEGSVRRLRISNSVWDLAQ